MRTGILGGTFDPPHLAHLVLAQECLYQLQLDRLLWILTPNSPLKLGRKISPLEQRLELLRAAVADNPAFVISTIDIDRPPPYYALDTVRLLRDTNPGETLVYLFGGDSLRDLPAWNRPAELIAAVDAFGVMRRPEDAVDLPALEATLPGINARVRFVDAPLLQISGTDIRARIAEGRPYRYFVPDAVYRLIEERRYYADWNQPED